jgi:recombination protein RecT
MAEAITKKDKATDTLQASFIKFRSQIEGVLPKHMTPERVLKVALSAMSRNFRLNQCTTNSILRAMMFSSQLGLEPGGLLGGVHLVPFRNKYLTKQAGHDVYEAQPIVDYRGLMELARRSGEVSVIYAKVVHEHDGFVYKDGIVPRLEHEPLLKGDSGKPIAVYAVAHVKDAPVPMIEVMTADQVADIRKRSRARDDGPWVTDEEQMWRKTVLRRLCNYLPMTPDLQQALEAESRAEAGEGIGDLLPFDIPENGNDDEKPKTSKSDAVISALTKQSAEKAKEMVPDPERAAAKREIEKPPEPEPEPDVESGPFGMPDAEIAALRTEVVGMMEVVFPTSMGSRMGFTKNITKGQWDDPLQIEDPAWLLKLKQALIPQVEAKNTGADKPPVVDKLQHGAPRANPAANREPIDAPLFEEDEDAPF